MKTTFYDDRIIRAILLSEGQGAVLHTLGEYDVIKPYAETDSFGEYSGELWFALIKNGEIHKRCNAKYIQEITYA